jgi:hypothetical protein
MDPWIWAAIGVGAVVLLALLFMRRPAGGGRRVIVRRPAGAPRRPRFARARRRW